MARTLCSAVGLAVALTLMSALPAAAQNPSISPAVAAAASQEAMTQLKSQSGGSMQTIDSINSSVLRQSRAYGASTGFSPIATMNSSLSGYAPSSATSGVGAIKPFSGMSPSSTISPYLNLFNQGPGGRQQTVDNYNVLVRPALEQQRTNQALQRQQQQLNMRVQAISAQAAFEAAGSERMIATGHQTGFGYYSHFYPGKNQAPRARAR
ncbi:hypothetical protein Pla108_10710 [Botrimarina colliarenosi]|uniref:Outer membrane efflux protein n=1 Tax=Botrimarina colliarenosi TaxID=2528001 RepID=A0A5C6AKZ0_9BACT|nr:hypothetical protein [Botrimarina colliarenosi]TWU00127.1 hypothetical protein Pla108_10710 [Botrimarina colliarenosi]